MTGISQQVLRRRCEQGRLDAYRTSDAKGAHWIIKLRPDEVADRDEVERLRRRNAELEATIDAMRKLLA